jgi:hypothetical protein
MPTTTPLQRNLSAVPCDVTYGTADWQTIKIGWYGTGGSRIQKNSRRSTNVKVPDPDPTGSENFSRIRKDHSGSGHFESDMNMKKTEMKNCQFLHKMLDLKKFPQKLKSLYLAVCNLRHLQDADTKVKFI